MIKIDKRHDLQHIFMLLNFLRIGIVSFKCFKNIYLLYRLSFNQSKVDIQQTKHIFILFAFCPGYKMETSNSSCLHG